MAKFMVEILSISESDLPDTLDQIEAFSPEMLSKIYWGDLGGEQLGWGMLEAESASDAREMLPPSLRETARIAEVRKFTKDDLRSLREESAG